MIVRKFKIYRNQVYLKSEGNQPTLPASTLKKTNPLLKYSTLITGRELFACDNHQSISAPVQQHSLDTGDKNSATVCQTILNEKWELLSGEGQSVWNDMSEAEAGDVGKYALVSRKSDTNPFNTRNQQEFSIYMNLALRDLCQGKVLGDAEMLLFYGFREQ
jgi:hypothetical protein